MARDDEGRGEHPRSPVALPRLRHVLTIEAEVAPDRPVGHVDGGDLAFIPITGGRVVGEVSGVVLDGGGDWAVVRGDHVTVEARYQLRTDDGHVVDVVNTGVAHFADETRVDLSYFATRPVFRVEAEHLQHLVTRVHVGWARWTPELTAVDVFEVLDPERG